MKFLIRSNAQLAAEARWDLDYHLPTELIQRYPDRRRCQVSTLALVSKEKRDPSRWPEKPFMYVDISGIDVESGTVANSQELTGEEAPLRARKVIRAYDVIVSTCRPTRGAIAVVPVELHDQICSTGFAVLRCREDVNPFYLHYVLRLASTSEQFRKFSTGSSYPAILDADVLKTVVPNAPVDEQDAIAASVVTALERRERAVREANNALKQVLSDAEALLCETECARRRSPQDGAGVSTAVIHETIARLAEAPAIGAAPGVGLQQSLI